MYFPFLHNKPFELAACANLHSTAQPTCPVVKLKFPSDEKKSKTFKKSLDSWVDISARQGSVSLVVDRETAGLVQASLGEVSPKANLRLAIWAVDGSELLDAAQDLNNQFNSGVLLLLTANDTANPQLMKWVASKQDAMHVDVAVNFGSIAAAELNSQADYAGFVLSRLGSAGVRNVIYIGGSYPIDNSNLQNGKVTAIERREWKIYKLLRQNHSISYGDFGPLSPILSTSRGRSKKVTPAIRYATDDHWMVHRGEHQPWDLWGPQMLQLTKDVVDAEYFSGSYFSWGDDQIEKAATGQIPPPGSWQQIRTIEINHHLSLAASATARLSGQLASPLVPQVAEGP